MLKLSRVSLILLFCCIAHALRSSKTHTQNLENDFCWKDSYGRGVGTIPNSCPSDMRCWECCATKAVPQDTRDRVWTVIKGAYQIGPIRDSSADSQNTDVVEDTLGNLETV